MLLEIGRLEVELLILKGGNCSGGNFRESD